VQIQLSLFLFHQQTENFIQIENTMEVNGVHRLFGYWHSSKYLMLVSAGGKFQFIQVCTTWEGEWVNNDRILIFGRAIPLITNEDFNRPINICNTYCLRVKSSLLWFDLHFKLVDLCRLWMMRSANVCFLEKKK